VRGYVVTFRQIDPLFVLDLQDAKAPKVLGELKIPGNV
jgi:inhibitor of cysteine peptidase